MFWAALETWGWHKRCPCKKKNVLKEAADCFPCSRGLRNHGRAPCKSLRAWTMNKWFRGQSPANCKLLQFSFIFRLGTHSQILTFAEFFSCSCEQGLKVLQQSIFVFLLFRVKFFSEMVKSLFCFWWLGADRCLYLLNNLVYIVKMSNRLEGLATIKSNEHMRADKMISFWRNCRIQDILYHITLKQDWKEISFPWRFRVFA